MKPLWATFFLRSSVTARVFTDELSRTLVSFEKLLSLGRSRNKAERCIVRNNNKEYVVTSLSLHAEFKDYSHKTCLVSALEQRSAMKEFVYILAIIHSTFETIFGLHCRE